MIEITNLVTLSDDNQYVVISKIIYNNVPCYYMVDINNNENFKFLYQDNDELVEIDDDIEIKKLLPLFYENIKENISEELLEEMKNVIPPEVLNSLVDNKE